MADKKLQMKEYNTVSALWENLLPVTGTQYVNGISSSIRDFLGTPSSAFLRAAVSDETGTGSLVFAQSATLTYSILNFATITASTVSNSTFINPILGTATANSINAVSLSASTNGFTIRNNTASIVRTGTGSLTFIGNTTSLTTVNDGFLLASDAAPSANEGKILQVVSGTPSWVAAGVISGAVNISGALSALSVTATSSITSNGTLVVKGVTTLTTSLNGIVIASSGVISSGSASLTNQVSGILPSGLGGTGIDNLGRTLTLTESGTALLTTATQTLANKTFNLSQNTFTASFAQLNTAIINATIVDTAADQVLTNKTLSTGTVSSAVVVQKSPVITLAGDLTGNVTLTNLASGTLTALIAANSVALGTDTTGNYVESLVAGTGITVTAAGEGVNTTVANNGVTSLVAGSNISVSSGTGAVTIATTSTPTFGATAITTLTLTNELTEANGGTGETTYNPGSILIGNSSNGLTKAFISGTTNEINVTTASAAITIGLPNIVSVVGLNASGRITASSINVGTIVGPTGFSDGTVGNPGINFTSDTDTGMYRSTTNTLNFATNGIERLQINTTQFTIVPQIVNLESYNSGVGSGKAVYVASTGVFGYLISTQKAKKDITSFNFDKTKFLELQPKSFKIKEEYGGNGTTQIGFIAEDADLLGLNYLVAKDSNGDIETFNYDKLSIYLMSIVKDQQQQIKSLVTRIEALEGN